jgi:hypothetical protein
MKRRLFNKFLCIISAVCLILPIFAVQVSAETYEINVGDTDYTDEDPQTDLYQLEGDINEFMSVFDPNNDSFTISGSNEDLAGSLSITLPILFAGEDSNFDYTANTPKINLIINPSQSYFGTTPKKVTISGSVAGLVIDPLTFVNDYVPPAAPAPPSSASVDPIPEGEVINPENIRANVTEPGQTVPTVELIDNTPVEIDGVQYYGTVDIVSVDSDTPQEIPSEVFIDGVRYAVGDVVYIVGKEEKIVEGTADTGFSYVFTAVENSDNLVKFTAEGLPEGLEMSEDGVITTKTLPAPVGTFEIIVTADNGLDTNEYKMTIVIKESTLTDAELLEALTANDTPGLLTEPQEDVPGVWTNDELSIHYEPEIEDFYALFLDGKLLTPETDYRAQEGSTVIILTEQTMAPLPSGDHVVTTMFHQNTDVGMDTVINDVGSSSYVFRFGDDKTSGKRVNIGGDGVTGSVTFDETNAEEAPITTITANSEAIEKRVQNLSNATGREIIAAFETKQHGGFGRVPTRSGVATFAVSVKSLDLSLKDGTSVYVAVYDSTTGKTYQNKGEVKDGMIVFRTKHSGVFMIALEKF